VAGRRPFSEARRQAVPPKPPKTGIARPLGNPFQYEHVPFIKDGAGYGEWDPEDAGTGEQPETTGRRGEQPGVFRGIVDRASANRPDGEALPMDGSAPRGHLAGEEQCPPASFVLVY